MRKKLLEKRAWWWFKNDFVAMEGGNTRRWGVGGSMNFYPVVAGGVSGSESVVFSLVGNSPTLAQCSRFFLF